MADVAAIKKSVLVVEDEELLLQIVTEELEETGFSVIAVNTVDAARRVLEADVTVDVVFTDIRLPGLMNGWQLGEMARTLRPGLPVAYATGYTDQPPPLIDRSLFFAKPYSVADVVETLQRLAGGKGGEVA